MPANLTPQYLDAEKRYRQAKQPTEKIRALEEMLAQIPKHKGTEKLQADIKRRIAKLKLDLERRPATKRGAGIFVARGGVGGRAQRGEVCPGAPPHQRPARGGRLPLHNQETALRDARV